MKNTQAVSLFRSRAAPLAARWGRLLLSLALALALLLSCVPGALALSSSHTQWPDFGGMSTGSFLSKIGYVHFLGVEEGFFFSTPTYLFIEVQVPEDMTDLVLEPEYFTVAKPETDGKTFHDTGIRYEDYTLYGNHTRYEAVADGPVDYSETQFWRVINTEDGRSFDMPVIALPQGDPEEKVNRLAALEARAEKFLSTMKRMDALYDELEASQRAEAVRYGAFHPSDINLFCSVANTIQNSFGFTISYFDTHAYWVEGTGWVGATVEDVLDFWHTYLQPVTSELLIDPEETITTTAERTLDLLLDVVAPYWIDYVENHRILEPEIVSYEIAGSRGMVDAATRTVTLRLPEDTDFDALPAPVVETAGEAKLTVKAGSLKSGEVVYSVAPGDKATGTWYDGHDTTGYGFGVDLSRTWKVKVETGVPYTQLLSFTVLTADGKRRAAKIEEGAVTLNLPVGTDLTALAPTLDYAGDGYYYLVNGERTSGPIDCTKSVELVITNTAYEAEARYSVNVTAEKSGENAILSYVLAGVEGTISGDAISLEIPYSTDLASAVPEISISEFAALTEAPEHPAEGANTYVVTAENGDARTYTATITRTKASNDCKLLSFKCGGYSAEIDEGKSAVALTLPRGLSPVFAPEITVSEFATVTPASGETQDFTEPVKYKVTSESGRRSKTYTVTVTISTEAAENPYAARMQKLVRKIIDRYSGEARDDWEWMDLGFNDNKLTNLDDGFSVAATLADLDSGTSTAMTNLARKLMTLTARGFDCTNLAQYNGGEAYTDMKGNPVDDLVSKMYSYSGGYTINGPIFALIALDMGNYTIPDNAVWTRGKLLDAILAYSGTEFGVDMVGAIMYAIAPYQNDGEYGERVQAKLEDCVSQILDSMNGDYSFGAWGATNSESTDWVLMGLCSAGIDCAADPRFSDGAGHSVLQVWFDSFANESDGYFHHNASLPNNAMATYEGCYTCMWYLGFLENGGQGNPYWFYYHRFDFAKALSAEAEILAFTLEGKAGVFGADGDETAITVTLPVGATLSNLTPELTLSEGATLLAPALPVTFVEGVAVPFTVLAADGSTTKTWYVTVKLDKNVAASGAELELSSLGLMNSVLAEEAILASEVTDGDEGEKFVTLTVKTGVNVHKMYLSGTISYGAKCDRPLDGKTAYDLSDYVAFTVTSEDGVNTKVYHIRVVPRGQAEILSFRVYAGEKWYTGTVDNNTSNIVVRGVDDSELTSLRLRTDIEFTGLTCSPASGVYTDFTNPVVYTLGGSETLGSRTYTATVLNQYGGYLQVAQPKTQQQQQQQQQTSTTAVSAPTITSFSVLGAEGKIDHSTGRIIVSLPEGTDVTHVVPVVTVPYGVFLHPAADRAVDLSKPFEYVVEGTNEMRAYRVVVEFYKNVARDLWSRMFSVSSVTPGHQGSRGTNN